jgi:transposase-like protein
MGIGSGKGGFMSYTKAGEIVQRAIDELIAIGASRDALVRHAGPLEMAAINSIADNSRKQLLLDLSYKTSDLAERYGVSDRTIRYWRKTEIDRQCASALSSATG